MRKICYRPAGINSELVNADRSSNTRNWKENRPVRLDKLENAVEIPQENFALSFDPVMNRLQRLGSLLRFIGDFYFLHIGWIQIS